MKRLLAALLVAGFAFPALCDSDGVEVLPFQSIGGLISGTATVSPDGGVLVQGQCAGVPFIGIGTATENPDGTTSVDLKTYSEGDGLIGKRLPIPRTLHLQIWPRDPYGDGNPWDDNVGDITLGSGTGMGNGDVQLWG